MLAESKSDNNGKGIWALAIHGGAGTETCKSDKVSEAHMADLLKEGAKLLKSGYASVEVVRIIVRELEACGLYLAGKGSAANAKGDFELDAAIMDGETRKAGAVACLQGFKHPVDVAELVMRKTSHVMLAGKGAVEFAKEQKCKRVKKPEEYYKPVKYELFKQDPLQMTGTVGAVALDLDGCLASATSTGGAPGKTPGRIGDTPIIGAGTWADERVAVSCTGMGEYFIRTSTASDVSARMHYERKSLDEATRAVLEDVVFLGGQGGLISIDVLGRIAMPFTSQTMKRGCIHSNGQFEVSTA